MDLSTTPYRRVEEGGMSCWVTSGKNLQFSCCSLHRVERHKKNKNKIQNTVCCFSLRPLSSKSELFTQFGRVCGASSGRRNKCVVASRTNGRNRFPLSQLDVVVMNYYSSFPSTRSRGNCGVRGSRERKTEECLWRQSYIEISVR